MNNFIEPDATPDILGVGILEENNSDAFDPDEDEDPEENDDDDDNWGEDDDE